jgi:hypothetical protein
MKTPIARRILLLTMLIHVIDAHKELHSSSFMQPFNMPQEIYSILLILES